MYQWGFPDIFIAHARYGQRWVEVKREEKFSFTVAQLIEFPKMEAAGVGIWVLTGCSDSDIAKLFAPPNWREYHLRKAMASLR